MHRTIIEHLKGLFKICNFKIFKSQMVRFGKIVYVDNLMARDPLNFLLYLYGCFFY